MMTTTVEPDLRDVISRWRGTEKLVTYLLIHYQHRLCEAFQQGLTLSDIPADLTGWFVKWALQAVAIDIGATEIIQFHEQHRDIHDRLMAPSLQAAQARLDSLSVAVEEASPARSETISVAPIEDIQQPPSLLPPIAPQAVEEVMPPGARSATADGGRDQHHRGGNAITAAGRTREDRRTAVASAR